MARITSSEANKALKKLNEELNSIMRKEEQSKSFLAALGEDPESVRPAYDYGETAARIDALEAKVRGLKHAINVFNTVTEVPEIGMSVDMALVYIPQLSKRCDKLFEMMTKLPKVRESASGYGRGSSIIDYRYTNYNAAEVEKDYYACKAELDRAQLQLDLVNSTNRFEIDDSLLD